MGKKHHRVSPRSAAVHIKSWWDEHETHPYPTKEEKHELASASGLTEKQVGKWMNHRRHKIKKASGEVVQLRQRLSLPAVDHLKRWWDEHVTNPYPTKEEFQELALETGLTHGQIDKWMRTRRYDIKKASGEVMTAPGRFSPSIVDHLERWFVKHGTNPYPNEHEKQELALATGLTEKQLGIWFCNRRRRIGKKESKLHRSDMI